MKAQAAGIVFAVRPAAIGGALGFGQYPDPFVVTDGLDMNAAPFGQHADGHHGKGNP
jgi:hypothetical protein